MQLDAKDMKILYELDVNARRSDAEIGKQVGLSREVVAYRIKKLMNAGIIKNFITLVNMPQTGLITFRVHFKFNSLTKKREEEIKEDLSKGAFWIVRVRGPWDFNAMFQTKQHYNFKEFLDKFKKKYGSYLEKYEVSILTTMRHYRRSYLLKDADPERELEDFGEGK